MQMSKSMSRLLSELHQRHLYELQLCTIYNLIFLYEISVNYFIVVGKKPKFFRAINIRQASVQEHFRSATQHII